MPSSFKSIYICQGDIGFFSRDKKTYGMFITFVNTYSTHVFACPVSNTKMSSLVEAVGQMLKVTPPPSPPTPPPPHKRMMGKFDMVYRRSTREFKKMFQSFFSHSSR
jgi:hypothetical protein